MPEAAPRLVIDCSRPAPPDPELVVRVEREAVGLLREGRTEEAENVIQQVKGMRESIALGPVETLEELTDAEVAQRKLDAEADLDHRLADLRVARDTRLAASDWTQGADAPLDEKATLAWRDYRQELRDYPATVNDPLDPPPWPEPPGGDK
jgi:hypothetical protein